MTFRQFMEILKARRILVLSVFAGIFLLALVVSFLLPKKYKATSAVIINSSSPDPINGTIMQYGMMPSYIATQIDVLTSDRVAQKVVKTLRLDESQQLREQWQSETDGVGSYQSWVADMIVKSLDVTPTRESSVLNISYSSVDPRFSAVLVNTFVQSYIDTVLELRVEPARQFTRLFDEQSKQARAKLEEAQNRLSDYQKANKLLVTDERFDVENARLAELSSQVVALQALSSESLSRRSNTNANAPEVLSNPVVSGLKADLSRLQARLQELSAKYGSAHPQVTELKANIGEMQAKIDAEIGRVKSSMGVSDDVNQSRLKQARNALDAQREKVLKLKDQRDQAAVLLRDVENAQKEYDALQLRASQTSLESQSNQTNVSVLKVATPPSKPSFPLFILNAIMGALLGLIVGIICALVVELRNRRLRTSEDIVEALGVPLLGAMPVAAGAKGDSLPVKSAPRLLRRSLPELSSPA